jgi:hypothetical protein
MHFGEERSLVATVEVVPKASVHSAAEFTAARTVIHSLWVQETLYGVLVG